MVIVYSSGWKGWPLIVVRFSFFFYLEDGACCKGVNTGSADIAFTSTADDDAAEPTVHTYEHSKDTTLMNQNGNNYCGMNSSKWSQRPRRTTVARASTGGTIWAGAAIPNGWHGTA